jgi:hypothetical protein
MAGYNAALGAYTKQRYAGHAARAPSPSVRIRTREKRPT